MMVLSIAFGLVGGYLFFAAGTLLSEYKCRSTIGLISLGLLCLFGMSIYSMLHERDYYLKNYPEIFEEEYREDKISKLEKQIEVLREGK